MIRLTFYRADGSKDMYHYADDNDHGVTTHLMKESQDDSVTIEIKIVEGQRHARIPVLDRAIASNNTSDSILFNNG